MPALCNPSRLGKKKTLEKGSCTDRKGEMTVEREETFTEKGGKGLGGGRLRKASADGEETTRQPAKKETDQKPSGERTSSHTRERRKKKITEEREYSWGISTK